MYLMVNYVSLRDGVTGERGKEALEMVGRGRAFHGYRQRIKKN